MKDDAVFLKHILDAIEKIEIYAAVGYDRFMNESQWQDAIIRQLEIIGEATKHLSGEIRIQHDYVPWRPIAGLRDVLIHNYMGVDLEAVWQITQKDIPEIKSHIEKMLAS